MLAVPSSESILWATNRQRLDSPVDAMLPVSTERPEAFCYELVLRVCPSVTGDKDHVVRVLL